jgi:hypothetical protein
LTTGAHPTGLSLNGTTNVISGTPTVENESGAALVYTVTSTTSGSTATQAITFYPIDTIAVPNCSGLDVGACVSALEAAFLDADSTFACNSSIDSSDVISQDPAASTEVEPESTVDLLVSRGACRQSRRIGIQIGIH